MRIPASEDWDWFGARSARELESLGVDSFRYTWILKAYAWFWSRLPKSAQERFEPPVDGISPRRPPVNLVPFPCAKLGGILDSDAGTINFLSVDSNGSLKCNAEAANCSASRLAHKAALFVYQIFQKYNPKVGFPNVRILSSDVEGGSLALSAMIAAFCQILKVEVPDSIIATGCFQTDEKGDSTLTPVEPGTFAQKLIASARFGYGQFFYVKGQKGFFRDSTPMEPDELLKQLKNTGLIPADSNLQVLEVEKKPMSALFRIAREIASELSFSTGRELAEFLHELSHQGHWKEPEFEQFLETFISSKSALVKHVALEMRSRQELHRGNTLKAQEFRALVEPLKPSDIPLGPLGSYLKEEETSSRVIQKLDLGVWEETDPDILLMDRILERQEGNIKDGLADIEDLRVALAGENTKARRLFFLGRLRRDVNLLRKAWDKLTIFQEYWDDIFAYTKEQNRRDEPLGRQLNQCLECQKDYWVLTGELFQAPFLQNFKLPENFNAYDLTAWLDWVLMYANPETIDFEDCLKKADHFYEGWKGHPCYMPYEKFLINKLGSPEQQQHARDQLLQAEHLKEPTYIMAILALRTARVLGDDALLQRAYDAVPDSLRWLADELMKKPEEIIFRCPY